MHIGTILIFLSLLLSFGLFIFLCINIIFKRDYAKVTEALFYTSGFLITMAVILLIAAFLRDRFDLTYVNSYSSKDLPIYYKVAGFWAGQEGTFLLWVFFLFIFGALIIRTRDDHKAIVLSVIVLTQGFILLILFRHSPFEYIWQTYNNIKPGQIPVDGSGLNPLLQDPWMIIHPPVLFLGYASASIPYAYAVAALIKKEYSEWNSKAYKWVLFCMTFLGTGIFLGAYWAYKVLGWGGYWGWDPVENSSLIPWLTIIALMHGLIIQKKKKNALVRTNIFLACLSLVLVFYSTFLTRSGILSDFSVHSFSDLGLKIYLIFYIIFFLFIGIYLLIKRYKDIVTSPLADKALARDSIINFGIVMLLFYAFFILIGTSMPILSGIFLNNAAAVNERFYNNISVPFGVLILIILIIATMYRSIEKKSVKNIILVSAFSLVFGFFFNIFYTRDAIAYIFSILGFFIVIQNTSKLIRYGLSSVAASRFAHLGIAVLVLGIITSNMHSHSIQKRLIKDIETNINSIKLTFRGINDSGISKLIFLYKSKNNEREIETPYYFNAKTNSLFREPYIDYGFFKDIYISPVEYENSSEGLGRILISKGEEKVIDGVKLRFIGYDIDNMHTDTGNVKLFVKLNANIDGKDYTIKPGLLIKSSTMREGLDAMIPVLNKKVALLDFNIAEKEILLYIEPDNKAEIAPDSVIVDVSFNRSVWLVWLGTVFIAIGGFLAIKKQLALIS